MNSMTKYIVIFIIIALVSVSGAVLYISKMRNEACNGSIVHQDPFYNVMNGCYEE